MPAKSVKQQRFFGMVRAAQKGEGAASPEVAKAASSISKKDAKDFASTKHKGLPMKKEEMEIKEGMTLKDFKANRRKLKRQEASADAEKRGHVGKEWHNTGRKYSADEAKSRRAKMSDDDRRNRYGSAEDPDSEDYSHYPASKTKNPKKQRKQAAMGEEFNLWVESLVEEGYDLSDFTWEEMYDIYEGEGSYGQTPKARQAMGKLAIARRDKPASEYSQKGEKTKKVKEIEKHTRRIDNGPDVGNRGKKSTKPRYSGMLGKSGRGKLDQDSRDHARDSAVEYTAGGHKPGPGTVTKNPKKLRKQKAMGEIGEQYISEEDYDRLKDRRMERGGVDGNTRYSNYKPSGGGAKKKPAKDVGMTALELVKAQIRAKHGQGAILDKKTKSEGYAPGDIDQKVGAVTAIPKSERDAARERLLKKAAEKRASLKKEEVIQERGDFWHPDPEKDRKLGGPGANQRAREDRAAAASKKDYSKTTKPGESYMDFHKRRQAEKKSAYMSSGSTARERLQKAGATGSAMEPKKKEGIVGKIARKVGLKKEGFITYREFIAEGNRTARMMQKSKTQVTGHISADRGDDEKANRSKRKELEKDLKKHGIGHKKGVGEYKYGSGETGREVSYQTSKPDKMSKRRFGKVMRRLGRKHGQESVITKDQEKSAKLHYTEKGSKAKSDSIGKTKAGKHPEGYGETSGTKVRGGKLPKKTTKGAFHYG
ncbi:hypothetical protein SSZBM1_194 [Synechococcus phage S-SZBM1]|uniref:Uncharacterized protein n=1 Tax=Synechococcus phage S-SZBM1 TaxID=2926475 RepID=A0AC61TT23_9CAUD|nr:hypothetical protein PP650_gp082 [Synechococcus phage S-SZBM1]UNH61311.1 hypothetical protein SSZBM1_194 [Synechococcus phage S-SZBM1]